MSDGHIAYFAEKGVASLVVTNPRRMNAMTLGMWSSVPALVARAMDDPSVRVIVVSGAGDKAFCAGADISEFGDQRTGEEAVRAYDEAVSLATRALAEAEKPVLALIRGLAFGGGLALALSCDLRIAATTARFRIPAARLGLGYAYESVEALVARIGLGPASDLLLTARIVDGAEAERLGLLTKAWAPGIFEDKASACIGLIAQNAPLTLRALKKSLMETQKPHGQRDRAGAERLIEACFRSADYLEGQASFLEKRTPAFRGL
jgi:enoyl-CoA hydratase/carnithine racemase